MLAEVGRVGGGLRTAGRMINDAVAGTGVYGRRDRGGRTQSTSTPTSGSATYFPAHARAAASRSVRFLSSPGSCRGRKSPHGKCCTRFCGRRREQLSCSDRSHQAYRARPVRNPDRSWLPVLAQPPSERFVSLPAGGGGKGLQLTAGKVSPPYRSRERLPKIAADDRDPRHASITPANAPAAGSPQGHHMRLEHRG